MHARLVLVLACVLTTVTGCIALPMPDHTTRRAPLEPSTANLVPVEEAARRWETELRYSNAHGALARNENNTVILRPRPGGTIIVNGERLHDGRMLGADDTIYLSPEMVRTVRDKLRGARETVPLFPAVRNLHGVTLVVDAGHGGRDPGAPNLFGGPVEKDINLDAALRLKERLRAWGATVIMTRTGDSFPSLDERVALSNRSDPDLFVSLHSNSASNPAANGFTTYIARKASRPSQEAARLMDAAIRSRGIPSRGVDRADFRVVARTHDPAMLLEMGFLTNPGEARLLSDPSYRQRLVEAIAHGLADMLEPGPLASAARPALPPR